MHDLNCEPLRAETLYKKPAQLNIIIDDKDSIHAHGWCFRLDPSSSLDGGSDLYKTLSLFTNLYRTQRSPALKSEGITTNIPFAFSADGHESPASTYRLRLINNNFLMSVVDVKTGNEQFPTVRPETGRSFESSQTLRSRKSRRRGTKKGQRWQCQLEIWLQKAKRWTRRRRKEILTRARYKHWRPIRARRLRSSWLRRSA
jgi:hypothetical protein